MFLNSPFFARFLYVPSLTILPFLLRALGWSPGGGLGASEQGIVEPIAVSLKKGRAGLGNNHHLQ